jgi:hypothetical protein
MQLIYVSRPFGFDIATLNNILFAARHHNKRDGITGSLICREDIYLQMLEGPRDLVTAAYGRIMRDDRHIEIVGLYQGDLKTRLFPRWEMRHDPMRSWMWTPDEVYAGAPQNASAEDLRAIFARIASEPYKEEILG